MVRIVLNNIVPEYRDADDAVPPSVASAAVITGANTFVYSEMFCVVSTPVFISAFDGTNNAAAIPMVPISSTVRAERLLKSLSIETSMQIPKTDTQEPAASDKLGKNAPKAFFITYQRSSVKDPLLSGKYSWASDGAAGAVYSVADTGCAIRVNKNIITINFFIRIVKFLQVGQ